MEGTSTQDIRFIVERHDRFTSARVGLLTIGQREIKTPIVWFGHSLKDNIRPWSKKPASCPALLVNACEILGRPGNRSGVIEQGVHGYCGYPGPILMDSGGFLFQNRELTACPLEILRFYRAAKPDLVVSLDHPLRPSDTAAGHRNRWRKSLENLQCMIDRLESNRLVPVIHGYTLRALKRACEDVRRIVPNPAVVGIGSLVPLIKASHLGTGFRYRRDNGETGNHVAFVADAVKLVRDEFPDSMLHVFGVGGITTMLVIFSAGADSVDSTTWRIKAAFGAIQLPGIGDRYPGEQKQTKRSRPIMSLEDRQILKRCRCENCSKYSALAWQQKSLAGSVNARCFHNSWVINQEIRAFQKSIANEASLAFLHKRLTSKHRLYTALEQVVKR